MFGVIDIWLQSNVTPCANCFYFTWLHPFLTVPRLFLFGISGILVKQLLSTI